EHANRSRRLPASDNQHARHRPAISAVRHRARTGVCVSRAATAVHQPAQPFAARCIAARTATTRPSAGSVTCGDAGAGIDLDPLEGDRLPIESEVIVRTTAAAFLGALVAVFGLAVWQTRASAPAAAAQGRAS